MREIKICSVTDKYITYLREKCPDVYSNKEENRTHTRKYIGAVLYIKGFNYYVPMSSPKKTDYQIAGEGKVIKKSIVPIMRIVVKNAKGEKELKGTLRISHMIPVPASELQLYDVEKETDYTYKDLLQSQIIFIRKNQEKIYRNAELLYKQKMCGDTSTGYVKTALDYMALEEMCLQYEKEGDR